MKLADHSTNATVSEKSRSRLLVSVWEDEEQRLRFVFCKTDRVYHVNRNFKSGHSVHVSDYRNFGNIERWQSSNL